MTYLDFSCILQACLLVRFTLSIPCVIVILTILCVCIILTPWMYDFWHTPVVRLYLLVSGTKYSLTLILSLTFLKVLFDWDDSHDQVSKLLKENPLCRIVNAISYHVMYGSPIYIQFLITDKFSDEKKMLMCLVRLLLNDFPFFSRIMAILLSW